MPTKATVAVCIDAHPKTHILLRSAANKAKELGVSWAVLYVETPDHYGADNESRERILEFITIAEEMGAVVRHIEHHDILKGLTNFIKNSQVKHLIMGQSSKDGFLSELRASLAERVTRELRKHKTNVQIIPLSSRQYPSSWRDRLQLKDLKIKEIGFALLTVFAAYVISEILRENVTHIEWKVNKHNVMAFFLISSVISSLQYGLVPGLVSAIAGFFVINYFYIAPLYNFDIDHAGDGVMLCVFLISALMVSLMGAYSRATNSALIRKERRTQALYNVHKLTAQATNQQETLKILHDELTDLLEMDIAFFIPSATDPTNIELAYPLDIMLSHNDMQSLRVCWNDVRVTGLGTRNNFGSSWRFEPLVTTKKEIGVLGIKSPTHIRLDASFGRLVTALADQAASILERINLTKLMSDSRIREEREKLRAMLLSSVSHDLKTPLASIIGSMSVYQRMRKSKRLDQETADELIETTLGEAQRLDSFISNILDMTRIESGDITFDKEWIESSKPIKNVKKRLYHRLSRHTLAIDPPDHEIFVQMDKMMTEQVLQNVIDNAVKYSDTNTTINLTYGKQNKGFAYTIRDHGPGIPEDKLEAVFDKYERLKQSDSTVAGTGLGLAIAKAVMEKQGGTISVKNHPDGGAVFTLWFPKMKIPKKPKHS